MGGQTDGLQTQVLGSETAPPSAPSWTDSLFSASAGYHGGTEHKQLPFHGSLGLGLDEASL